jgi:GNAT superfamily N-acetyltransferase
MTADQIVIRRALPSEARAVADLYIASRRGASAFIPTVHTDDETRAWVSGYLVPRLEVWVAESNGKLLGMMALEDDLVDQLYIAPEAQRRGVGDRLLAHAKKLRPARLRLYTFQRNAPARRFYEARGFVAIEFNDGSHNEEHAPDVLYQWNGASAPGADED